MEASYELLERSVDERHRGFLHATRDASSIPVLRIRAPKAAWRLHPDWFGRLYSWFNLHRWFNLS